MSLVRQKDGGVRGFVNACRHRGNAFCEGQGHAARFTCPYHNWSYALDGQCLAVAKPDYDGPVEEFVGDKADLGLIAVPVEEFAGFLFLNPDPAARPLAEFLGPAGPVLEAYRLDDMIPYGLNVRETIRANWKAALDAFLEGYHVQGIHPELLSFTDIRRERCGFFGLHAATTVPFGAPGKQDAGGAEGVAIVRGLPAANFPGLAEVLPRFEQLVAGYGAAVPDDVTGRSLLQQATRESMTEQGADVARLTDNQLSDYQFWLLFPNVYMQLRSGEATVIWFRPDPAGDPSRCFWQVTNLQWFPKGERDGQARAAAHRPRGRALPLFPRARTGLPPAGEAAAGPAQPGAQDHAHDPAGAQGRPPARRDRRLDGGGRRQRLADGRQVAGRDRLSASISMSLLTQSGSRSSRSSALEKHWTCCSRRSAVKDVDEARMNVHRQKNRPKIRPVVPHQNASSPSAEAASA